MTGPGRHSATMIACGRWRPSDPPRLRGGGPPKVVEGVGGLKLRGARTRAPSVSASRRHLPASGEDLYVSHPQTDISTAARPSPSAPAHKIGRASCRERVCQYV